MAILGALARWGIPIAIGYTIGGLANKKEQPPAQSALPAPPPAPPQQNIPDFMTALSNIRQAIAPPVNNNMPDIWRAFNDWIKEDKPSPKAVDYVMKTYIPMAMQQQQMAIQQQNILGQVAPLLNTYMQYTALPATQQLGTLKILATMLGNTTDPQQQALLRNLILQGAGIPTTGVSQEDLLNAMRILNGR